VSRVTPNQHRWSGPWGRSLPILDLAAERAAVAGDFDPYGSELVLEWPEQDRSYPCFNDDALNDTRRYGHPARAKMAVWNDDRLQGEVTLVADDYGLPGDGDRPTVRVSARGVAGDSVKAAFDAACATLSDEGLATATPRDVLEIRAVENVARARDVADQHPVRHRLKQTVQLIEAHPAIVSVVGIVVTALIAVLVG
jgi:hypothetical protein